MHVPMPFSLSANNNRLRVLDKSILFLFATAMCFLHLSEAQTIGSRFFKPVLKQYSFCWFNCSSCSYSVLSDFSESEIHSCRVVQKYALKFI